jgi:hypothetical protein
VSPATTPTPRVAAKVDLGVPGYVHPLRDAGFWSRLTAASAHVRFVVVNVHDGPGADLDPAYPDVVRLLDAARIRTIGYVDTDYGRRPSGDVVDDARRWVTRYGIRGVFLDQVAPGFEHLDHYAGCALGARAAGAPFVVLNPGTDCHPGYADIANVTVTFEGTWTDYLDRTPADWMLARPAARFCHLVHTVPTHQLPHGPAAAAARHAGTAFFTDGAGANPWDRLPAALVEAVATAHPGAVPARTAGLPDWGRRTYAGDPAPARPAVAVGMRARIRAVLAHPTLRTVLSHPAGRTVLPRSAQPAAPQSHQGDLDA